MFLQYGMLFTFTVIHFDFPKHSCTATIAYDIDVGHISTRNFFHIMPETDFWRDMSP